jgi:predicted ester cyclase
MTTTTKHRLNTDHRTAARQEIHQGDDPTMPTTIPTAADLAHAVLEAMNTGQLERIRDLVTDDFVDHGSPVPVPPGPDGYIGVLGFVTDVLKIRVEVDEVIAAGDSVAIRAIAHGVHNVAPPGIEPTGRPYAMPVAHFYRARDGRLSEHWGIRDELDVLFQVGALTRPGATQAPS